MTLPAGPPLKLSEAFTEFTEPATSGLSVLGGASAFKGGNPVTLPAANVIKMSDLYGLEAKTTIVNWIIAKTPAAPPLDWIVALTPAAPATDSIIARIRP